MKQESYDNVKALLDSWAEHASIGGRITDGVPRQCVGAPDARIHSLEDMEIEVSKRLVKVVDTAVYELPVMERNVVLMHYGIMTVKVWRADFTTLFDLAIESLFNSLKSKISC